MRKWFQISTSVCCTAARSQPPLPWSRKRECTREVEGPRRVNDCSLVFKRAESSSFPGRTTGTSWDVERMEKRDDFTNGINSVLMTNGHVDLGTVGKDSDLAAQRVVGDDCDETSGSMQAAILKALENSLGSPLGNGPQAPAHKPLVIVISGPSGVGKDAVIKRLQEIREKIHFVVTATTRLQRPGEVDGVDYFFVSENRFVDMIQKDELLEHAIVYGDYKGIPKQQVRESLSQGVDVVLRVDVQGAATVRSILGSNAVFIFLVAESEVALVKRLIQRKTETLEKVILRIGTARKELSRLNEFDYVVVNADGHLERTVASICAIIDSEKSKVHARDPKL